jgi:hypothetical protein
MEARWYHYILAFVAGAIFVNVMPHFMHGVSGRPFPSPFADPPGVGLSSPVQNVAWAAINFTIACSLVLLGKLHRRSGPLIAGYLIGALVMAFYLAHYFGKLGLA